ncbi:MAG: DUF4321 domain-containing protein [Armatimonadota bacterium]|nr:DUF4321 domain-containing protein [Armatimonadota bacterium]MDR5675073.1 DUF4321 domain-containing protein [Armatimonadota bacterium]MDR5688514.1 DUF4321 domain-containing protein [Armatimonadota bacterium]MDR7386771.1 DUF4321 domain-containing protein [Armatimonadota bacterium]MDR7389576.1 DUF4321 domain-containing protein [Armatimonadota bacterium]
MTRRTRRSWVPLVFVVLAGGVLGQVLAEAVSAFPQLSFLARSVEPGLDPALHLDLGLVTFTLGFTVRLNLAVLLGVVFALWLWRWV